MLSLRIARRLVARVTLLQHYLVDPLRAAASRRVLQRGYLHLTGISQGSDRDPNPVPRQQWIFQFHEQIAISSTTGQHTGIPARRGSELFTSVGILLNESH
jgi:hypothetical protein